MGYTIDSSNQVLWNYTLTDGICTDSMALTTAKAYGIDQTIISRATELGAVFDKKCRPAAIDLDENQCDKLQGTQDSSNSIQMTKEADNGIASSIPHSFIKAYDLSAIESMIIEILGSKEVKLVKINSDEDPPSSLEGKSCVYVLRITTPQVNQSTSNKKTYLTKKQQLDPQVGNSSNNNCFFLSHFFDYY